MASSEKPRVSASAASIKPFLVMEILEAAQELERRGVDVVHLEVGEPDFDVPPCVRQALEEAIRAGHTHYTHSQGLQELREEIAAYYAREYDVQVGPERIIVTTGTSGGVALVMALLVDSGDEVLLPDPGYACYPAFVRAFHGSPRPLRLDPACGYQYDAMAVRAAASQRTKALFVNSPSNPTSAVQHVDTLESLARLGLPLISDEIYHGIVYGPPATSMLQVTDDCFVLDGFSKRYAMTGLRLGWLVAPECYVAPLQRLQQNLFICASSLAQHAGVAALRHAENDVKAMLGEYRKRREVVLAGLEDLGFEVVTEPMGAYYILVDARHLDRDSLRLAKRILEEAHVGVTPGVDFGAEAEGHLRFSFASSLERIEEGLRRLRAWLKKQKR
jgi:aspartate/methionine/tyrosine aminotransferase